MRRTVDLRWVRRTLARGRWLVDHAADEDLANILIAHGDANDLDDVESLGQYLVDVAEYMRRRRPEQEQPCAVCGTDMRMKDVARPDARYCSSACRQRAYRQRVTGRQSGEQRTRNDRVVRDTSLDLSAARSVTAVADPRDERPS